jgi:hypothetical protein
MGVFRQVEGLLHGFGRFIGGLRGRWDGEHHRTQKRKALRQVFHFVTNSKNCFGLEMMAGGSGS